MISDSTALLIIIGLLILHLLLQIGYQYQALNLLDEIAFPSNDPIMTSTLTDEKTPVKEEPTIPAPGTAGTVGRLQEAANGLTAETEFHGVTVAVMGGDQALVESLRQKFPMKKGIYWNECVGVDSEGKPCVFATKAGERFCWACEEKERKAWSKENMGTLVDSWDNEE